MVGELRLSWAFFPTLLPNILTAAQFIFVAVRHKDPMFQPTVVYIPREPNLLTLRVIFFLPKAPLDIWLHSFQPLFSVPHHLFRLHRALSTLRL